jgi:hypothetical protein
MRCGSRTRIQQHGDASLFHLLPGEFAQLGCHFGQNLVLGMYERDTDIVFAEIAVEAGAAANELIDFAGDFDTAETGSHDDEAEMPTTEIRISSGFGEFHLMDDVLAKIDGVAHDFEGEGVIAHSGYDSEIAFRAAGNDDMIVVQAYEGSVAIVELDFRGGKVYSLHALGTATYARKHLAERGGGGVGIDGGSSNVGEERMKDHMVLAVE